MRPEKKPPDRCKLEKLVDGRWLPMAIRYHRFSAVESRALALGEIVVKKDGDRFRRWDWVERQALARALGR